MVRDEIMSGKLGAVGAKCSTLFYDPCDCGTEPTSTGRISVLTNNENYVEVGLRLVKLKVVQHDIKYKTLEASRHGVYAHSYNTKKPISNITIFWNEGNPYDLLKPRPAWNY